MLTTNVTDDVAIPNPATKLVASNMAYEEREAVGEDEHDLLTGQYGVAGTLCCRYKSI